MRKASRLLAFSPALLAFSAGAVVWAQDRSHAEDRPFVVATPAHMMEAVQTCENAKGDSRFNTAQMGELGWRRLSPPSGTADGQAMFANRPSGASITIASNKGGADRVCIIIGWVDSRAVAQTISGEIANEVGLTLQTESPHVTSAQRAGWTYTIALFSKPDVTNQTRMIVVIAPTEDGAKS